ncbi:hypothetical protein BGX29_004909, partial [Mortierella sp. GBA35]
MNEFSARLNALASRLDSYIQQQATESHATNTRLEAKLDRLLNAIGTPPVQSPVAIESEDIELEQADDIVPATPPHKLQPSTTQEQ